MKLKIKAQGNKINSLYNSIEFINKELDDLKKTTSRDTANSETSIRLLSESITELRDEISNIKEVINNAVSDKQKKVRTKR